MGQTLIRWQLAELMARHRIKGADLAGYLEISGNAMSNLRNARTMPRLDGDRLNGLLHGLNELADPETKDQPIDLLDLMKWVPDEGDRPA